MTVRNHYNGSSDDVCVYDGYVYQYDKQNKISAEKAIDKDGNITDKYSYEYDKAGQLVRFNDAVADKTYTYTYDDNGNILAKKEYAYSTTTLGAPTDTITYSYDSQWKDKLTSVGDKTISYDNIGNPTVYFGADLTWEGRNLTSFDNNVDREITYQYDENGMRYHTTVKNKEDGSEITFDYVWVDSKLISTVYTENNKTKTAKYIYNDFDEPVGMLLTDEETGVRRTYYYLKNAQGDITNIVSSSGSKMVEFTYDAWGKRTIHYQADVSNPNNIIRWFEQVTACALTPFGYRGYCYDMYTDLYYLQSRYYDPNTGRFINADDTNYLNATGTVLGCNLFAYCENDGVNLTDKSGNFSGKQVADILSKILKNISSIIQFLQRQCYGKGVKINLDKYKTPKQIYNLVKSNSTKLTRFKNKAWRISFAISFLTTILTLASIIAKNTSISLKIAEILFYAIKRVFSFLIKKFVSGVLVLICGALRLLKSVIEDIVEYVFDAFFDIKGNKILKNYLNLLSNKKLTLRNMLSAFFTGIRKAIV